MPSAENRELTVASRPTLFQLDAVPGGAEDAEVGAQRGTRLPRGTR